MELKDEINQAKDIGGLRLALKNVNTTDLSSVEIQRILRKIKKFDLKPDIKVAYLSNYTIEPLSSYIEALSVKVGITTNSYISPYKQYYQELLSGDSGLYTYQPDVIFLSLILEEISKKITKSYLQLSPKEIEVEQKQIVEHICDWIALAQEKTNALLLVSNFVRPVSVTAGISDTKLHISEISFYADLNQKLSDAFKKEDRVFIFDIEKLSSQYGLKNALSKEFYYLAKIPWHEKFNLHIADEFIKYLASILNKTKKCLVVDLDNTLWGGVLGEDGINGIKIGTGDPVAEAYTDFQYWLKSLKNKGLILAICSKNNEHEVQELFLKRKDIPLELEDFSAIRINWNNKTENIAEIAEELNINVDSLVFVDDSDVECELVNQVLPQVDVIQVKGDPSGYSQILSSYPFFEKLVITNEDQDKSIQYKQNKDRERLKSKIDNLDKYLARLETRMQVFKAQNDSLQRVSQLFSKTNQFNLTTIRYNLSQIENFISSSEFELFLIKVSDKYGELGIVGLCLLKLTKEELEIDSFLLSCRVLGRGVETQFMNWLKSNCFKQDGLTSITAKFIPTDRNMQTVTFFEDQGFALVKTNSHGEKYYRLNNENISVIPCEHIQLEKGV